MADLGHKWVTSKAHAISLKMPLWSQYLAHKVDGFDLYIDVKTEF